MRSHLNGVTVQQQPRQQPEVSTSTSNSEAASQQPVSREFRVSLFMPALATVVNCGSGMEVHAGSTAVGLNATTIVLV